LAAGGVDFRHGDIRNPEDLADTGSLDLLVQCSAEPVQAGLYQGERYLINTNLIGTIDCLDRARRHYAAVVFLSTSRIYPIVALRELPLVPAETRFVISASNTGLGWSARGITESFLLIGSRSLYGARPPRRVVDDDSYGAERQLRDVASEFKMIIGNVRDPGCVANAVAGGGTFHHFANLNGTENFSRRLDRVPEVGARVSSRSEVYQTPPKEPPDKPVQLFKPDLMNPRLLLRWPQAVGRILSRHIAARHVAGPARINNFPTPIPGAQALKRDLADRENLSSG
jgi:hypothetical protein